MIGILLRAGKRVEQQRSNKLIHVAFRGIRLI